MSKKYLVIGHNEENGVFTSNHVALSDPSDKDQFLKEALRKIREFSQIQIDHILIVHDDNIIEDRFAYEID